MIETSETIATRLIEAREMLWSGLVTFAANPIFPAVTALLGAVTGAFVNQGAVDRRERKKVKQEVEAFRTLLRLEIEHNFERIGSLLKMYETYQKILEQPQPPAIFFPPYGLEFHAFETLLPKMPFAMDDTNTVKVYETYHIFRNVKYAFEAYQVKEIRDFSPTTLKRLKENIGFIVSLLRDAQTKENPFVDPHGKT